MSLQKYTLPNLTYEEFSIFLENEHTSFHFYEEMSFQKNVSQTINYLKQQKYYIPYPCSLW